MRSIDTAIVITHKKNFSITMCQQLIKVCYRCCAKTFHTICDWLTLLLLSVWR